MKAIGLLLAVASIHLSCSAVCEAQVVIQRNRVDGSFVWSPTNTACVPSVAKYLDISLPLSQSGSSSNRRGLFYNDGCFLGGGCTAPAAALLLGNSDAQPAGGGIFSYDQPCSTSRGGEIAAWKYGYNETIGPASAWTSSRVMIGYQGWGSNIIWEAGTGPFTGVRVRLSDGWHYGWVIKSRKVDASGASAGTYHGELRPYAYGLASQPDVAITTPCAADANLDLAVDFFDYLDFIDWYSAGDLRADFDQDGSLDFYDYLDFVDAFAAAC